MHNNGVIHRDIRPENIIFDAEGYCKLSDFCMARVWQKDNASDTSGIPGYIAPEVMLREPHSIQSDYFQIGIVAHELMKGCKPWDAPNREVYRENLLKTQYSIKKAGTPETWTHEASDFINKCIKRKCNQRLGLNGPQELKNHIWFREFDWTALTLRKANCPFVPTTLLNNYDSNEI